MKKTKKTARKTAHPKFKGRHSFDIFVDDLLGTHEIPSIVLEVKLYDEMRKELASLRERIAIAATEARAAEDRYAVAIAALEQANGQIMALKVAVDAFAHSTEALGRAVQPAKIDRWCPPDTLKAVEYLEK